MTRVKIFLPRGWHWNNLGTWKYRLRLPKAVFKFWSWILAAEEIIVLAFCVDRLVIKKLFVSILVDFQAFFHLLFESLLLVLKILKSLRLMHFVGHPFVYHVCLQLFFLHASEFDSLCLLKVLVFEQLEEPWRVLRHLEIINILKVHFFANVLD